MKRFWDGVKSTFKRLASKFSFRTGVIMLITCVFCYAMSFLQMLIPMSAKLHTILFVTLFGLAKTTQYFGLTIVGVEGWQRIRAYLRLRRKKA